MAVYAGPVIYNVLNRNGSIARIPAGGGPATTISNSFGGVGLALDNSSNFIVATGYSLMKVTPGGASSLIANAPAGSQFIDVAVDGSGNYIVADNQMHRILRVSSDGSMMTPVASYPVTNNEL